jgi:hypothetical protein
MRVELGTTFTHISVMPLPWSGAAFSAMIGTNADGEPLISVWTEWPLQWMRSREQASKFELEWLHLRRYSSDRALATGTHAWGDIRPGDDPPDATVLTDAGRMGVEATALTIESRRVVHDLFGQLRRGLQQQEPAIFARLAAHVVYVWFRDTQALGPPVLPHRRSDLPALNDLIAALSEYEPAAEELRHDSGPAPQTMPELPVANTSAGATFYSVPLLGAVPGSMLFTIAGFDIALAYTTIMTAQEGWNELQRLVDGHDKPGVEVLLVTAGGPDRNGNIYPAEEGLANFVIEHPIGLSHAPKHIKEVILHSWGTGRATHLHPVVAPLFGPLYGSMIPVHHPFAGQSADETATDADTEVASA